MPWCGAMPLKARWQPEVVVASQAVGNSTVGLRMRIAYEPRASSGFMHCNDGLPLESWHGIVPPTTMLLRWMASMSGPAIDTYEVVNVYGLPSRSVSVYAVPLRLNVNDVVVFVVGSVSV